LTVRWARRFNRRSREQPTGFALEQMAQLPGICKLSDGRRADLIVTNYRLYT
jgi:hypothetical protein